MDLIPRWLDRKLMFIIVIYLMKVYCYKSIDATFYPVYMLRLCFVKVWIGYVSKEYIVLIVIVIDNF